MYRSMGVSSVKLTHPFKINRPTQDQERSKEEHRFAKKQSDATPTQTHATDTPDTATPPSRIGPTPTTRFGHLEILGIDRRRTRGTQTKNATFVWLQLEGGLQKHGAPLCFDPTC